MRIRFERERGGGGGGGGGGGPKQYEFTREARARLLPSIKSH